MIEELLKTVPILLILGIVILAGPTGYFMENKAWNKGVSPTGNPWRYFDSDSHGSRGYTDDDNNVIWISWSRIDKH